MSSKFKLTLFWVLFVGLILLATALNILFPPRPVSVYADGSLVGVDPSVDQAALIDEYGYFVPGNQLIDSDNMVDHIPLLKGWLPDDYTYGDFLLDTASAFIGSATAINSETVDLAIDTVMDLIDDAGFFLDTSSGFVRVPNLYDTLSDFQGHYGYSQGVGVVGNWIQIPITFKLSNGETIEFEHVSGDPIFICQSGSILCFATRSSSYASFRYKRSSNPNQWITSGCYTAYSGSLYSGFVGTLGLTPLSGEFVPYYNNSDAFSDFFGSEIEYESIFNGSVYLVSDLPSVNIFDIPGNDGRDKSIQRNTDINNNIYNPYGGYNNIVLSPSLEDIPNNHVYELPVYPEIPHDLPEVELSYPEVLPIQGLEEGLDNLNGLWVTLLVMGGSFIVLKVIL